MKTALFLLLIAANAQTFDEKGLERKRVVIARKLHDQQYFKDASCKDVANTFLEHLKLPKIGSTAPPQGQRLTVKRGDEKKAFPKFTDGFVNAEKRSVVIDAAPQGSKEWVLKIERKQSNRERIDHLKTRFTFEADNSRGFQVCNLTKAEFALSPHVGDKYQTATLNCIDDFVLEPLQARADGSGLSMENIWMQEDCATALHFSKAAKDLVNKR